MWSVGCILAEMLKRDYLFRANSEEESVLDSYGPQDVLKLILDMRGSPTDSEIDSLPTK